MTFLLVLAVSTVLAQPVPGSERTWQEEEDLLEQTEALVRDVDRYVEELSQVRKGILPHVGDPLRLASFEGERQKVRRKLHSLASRSDELYARGKELNQTHLAEVILMIKDDPADSAGRRPKVAELRRVGQARSRLHTWRDKALNALKEDEHIVEASRKEFEENRLRSRRIAHARGKRIRLALFFGVVGVCLLGLLAVGPKLRSG